MPQIRKKVIRQSQVGFCLYNGYLCCLAARLLLDFSRGELLGYFGIGRNLSVLELLHIDGGACMKSAPPALPIANLALSLNHM